MTRPLNPDGEPDAGHPPSGATRTPSDERVITTVSMPRRELERLDALAAALGVDRGRLLRAAALWATQQPLERVRLWLSYLPRNREWRERLLDVLTPERAVDLGELAGLLGTRRDSFRSALDRLVEDGLVARSGLGRRGSPLRFRRTLDGERRRAQVQRADYERAAAARLAPRGY